MNPTSSRTAAAILLFGALMSGPPAPAQRRGLARELVLSRDALQDKIMGGWAGQTIGCTYGGPTEFRFQSTFIPDYQPIPWSDEAVASAFRRSPGLYDDVYMDLTFVKVFEELGLDAPAEAFARAFAGAPYPLWHANQMARYNIQNGLLPPQSGHWLRNPHADDIDFQIEADFAGLMAPGLPNAAAAVCDRVGHIMNYGDGWYGGVYIAALYALAFVRDDIPALAEEALKVIPERSLFARTMRDVLDQHRRDPGDWKAAWFRIQRTFGEDTGCPEGVFSTFNIDAKINAAWVLVGLLYGGGDFGRTMDIAARCGDDSDCNPASAAGVLGVMRGYSGIPAAWRKGLAAVEDTPFPYVGISLRRAAELSAKHARAMVLRRGGAVTEGGIRVAVEDPAPVAYEAGFAGLVPRERRSLRLLVDKEWTFEFEGTGFALGGEADAGGGPARVFRVEARVDGGPAESFDLPTDDRLRRETLCWNYALADGPHRVALRILNPAPPAGFRPAYLVVYGPAREGGAR